MPKISADTVAAHVAQQRAAVVDAAAALFAERGITEVSMSDIADAVGLARNSLYRYFPDKGHILAAWLTSEIDPLVVESLLIAEADTPPSERLDQWLSYHLALGTNHEHRLMERVADEIGSLPAEVRAEIGAQHRRLYGTIEPVMSELLAHTDRSMSVVAALIGGMLRSASELVNRGVPIGLVEPELLHGVAAVVRID
jgi:AcrR family transcriptional regulator